MENTSAINPRRMNTFGPEWERVNDSLRRMKTPGGWLVTNNECSAFGNVTDPNFIWQFKKEGEEIKTII